MNKEVMMDIVKQYLAEKFQCDVQALEKSKVFFSENKQQKRLKMLLFRDSVVVSSSRDIYDFVSEKLKDKSTYEIFEFPLVYGQSIYYIPNLSKIIKQDVLPEYEFRLFDGNTNEIEVNDGFENAITFDSGKCVSNIAYCAYKDGRVVGVAGADRLTDSIWEVGIEVLPEYRNEGIATVLTKNVTLKILEKGIVPIWCASVSNIGSQAVAANSDYIPLWMETYGDIFEDSYVYKDIFPKCQFE